MIAKDPEIIRVMPEEEVKMCYNYFLIETRRYV